MEESEINEAEIRWMAEDCIRNQREHCAEEWETSGEIDSNRTQGGEIRIRK